MLLNNLFRFLYFEQNAGIHYVGILADYSRLFKVPICHADCKNNVILFKKKPKQNTMVFFL